MDPISAIKEQISIVDLIARAGLTVAGHGRVLATVEHDSLKLFTDTNTWYWFSRAIGGDVFDWWILQHNCDFRRALEDLANLAGVELTPLTPERHVLLEGERTALRVLEIAAQHFNQLILTHPGAAPAREYCRSRGWSLDTIKAARLGYRIGDSAPLKIGSLAAKLSDAGLLDTPAAKAVLSIPDGFLVYVHQRGGQVVYLSARSIREKRHYNLPADLVGERQPYELRPLTTAAAPGATLLVEGQADCISLAQLGFHAIALCGLQPAALNLARVTHVALDNDTAGAGKALPLALAAGPLCQIVTWPAKYDGSTIKDANDLLKHAINCDVPPSRIASEIGSLLAMAPSAIETLAGQARSARSDDRVDLIGALSAAYAQLDDVTATDLAPRLADALGVNYRQFRRLMTAAEKEARAGETDSPARYESSAGAALGGWIFEQCVRWDEHGTPSCYYSWRDPSGEIKTGASVTIGDVTYLPHSPTLDLIRKRVVLFPSEAADYGSQRQLLADIRAFIHRWLDVDPFYEQLASYYVLFSWVYDAFETLPYLRAFGDYGTGKSRFLQTIGALCYRPMFVSGASTASPIFRLIDLFRGTLIMDEADFANSDAEAEMIKIVNVGYSRGGVVLRAEKDDTNDSYYPSAKDVYGPKILATRRMFRDRATESRCLTKRMSTARPRPDVPRIITREFWESAQGLRNKCLAYRLRTFRPIDIDSSLSDQSIEPRLDQVTLALKAIVDDAAMLDQINLFIRAYNATLISDRQMSLPAIVVQVLAEIYYKPDQTLAGERRDWSIKNIAERVRLLLDTLDPDEKISPRRVATLLNEDLGLSRRVPDPETRRHCLAVDEPALQALMARYGIERP